MLPLTTREKHINRKNKSLENRAEGAVFNLEKQRFNKNSFGEYQNIIVR